MDRDLMSLAWWIVRGLAIKAWPEVRIVLIILGLLSPLSLFPIAWIL